MRDKSVIFACVCLLVAGCASKPSTTPDTTFAPDTKPHPMDEINAAQSAAGAKSDGTLYPCHFDGEELNSLGRSKLYLMAEHRPARGPLVVYVNVTGDGSGTDARKEAIRDYLADMGLTGGAVQIKTGPNSATSFAAHDVMQRLSRTESTEDKAVYSETSSSSSSTSASSSTPSSK